MPKNLTEAMVGISAVGDYSGSATAGAAVQKLIDILTPDATSTIRNFLDEMSPAAQVQLIVELTAIIDEVGAFEA